MTDQISAVVSELFGNLPWLPLSQTPPQLYEHSGFFTATHAESRLIRQDGIVFEVEAV